MIDRVVILACILTCKTTCYLDPVQSNKAKSRERKYETEKPSQS